MDWSDGDVEIKASFKQRAANQSYVERDEIIRDREHVKLKLSSE